MTTASGASRIHLRAPKISKSSWGGGGGHAPRSPPRRSRHTAAANCIQQKITPKPRILSTALRRRYMYLLVVPIDTCKNLIDIYKICSLEDDWLHPWIQKVEIETAASPYSMNLLVVQYTQPQATCSMHACNN
jgi:hypothetical protein